MARVLVAFESKYGQAAKIAEHLGQETRRRGHLARVLHLDVARGLDLATFDEIIVVAPVYFAHHPRKVASFVRWASTVLAKRRSALVSVSNSAAGADPAARANAMRVARAFVSELPWTPDVVTTAGGALAYPRYNWALRFVMKRIARATGAPLDTTRTHELTDWAALDADLDKILAPLAGELPRHDDLDAFEHAAQ